MNNLEIRIAICPEENKLREFVLSERIKGYGTCYECRTCGKVVNECYFEYLKRVGEHKV